MSGLSGTHKLRVGDARTAATQKAAFDIWRLWVPVFASQNRDDTLHLTWRSPQPATVWRPGCDGLSHDDGPDPFWRNAPHHGLPGR